MVPIIKNIEEKIINDTSLETVMYYSFYGKELDSFDEQRLTGTSKLAFKGYRNIKVDKENIDSIINRPMIKGIDYSNNIYNFIGIHLASEEYCKEEIQRKFNSFSIKNKFAICLFFPDFKTQLIDIIKNSKNVYERLLEILFCLDKLTNQDEQLIYDTLTNNSNADVIDVILYNEILKKYTRFEFNNKTAVDLIKDVFNNFQDSIKHITEIRRKDHDLFKIEDEYDVQDVSYLILRSVFTDLQFENPHFKSGGTYSRVDLMLEQEGIDIELKMIKKTDKDEASFIKQIKVDFNDYATWADLKDLIVFIYDPYNKTTNKNNFYELSGRKVINNADYNVHIIVSN